LPPATAHLIDIMGVSGRPILQALGAGEASPERVADLARAPVTAAPADLSASLHARVTTQPPLPAPAAPHPDPALEAAGRELEARRSRAVRHSRCIARSRRN
jgi:hypothetical protein